MSKKRLDHSLSRDVLHPPDVELDLSGVTVDRYGILQPIGGGSDDCSCCTEIRKRLAGVMCEHPEAVAGRDPVEEAIRILKRG